jgi:hypothetical protein
VSTPSQMRPDRSRPRSRRCPLPAGSQLGEHEYAKGQKRAEGTAERGEASADLLGGLQLVTSQACKRAAGKQTADDYVRRAPPVSGLVFYLCQKQLGELVAVSGPPRRRVPAQQPPHLPGFRDRIAAHGRAHAEPQLFSSRLSPTSATRRWSARCVCSARAPAAVSW